MSKLKVGDRVVVYNYIDADPLIEKPVHRGVGIYLGRSDHDGHCSVIIDGGRYRFHRDRIKKLVKTLADLRTGDRVVAYDAGGTRRRRGIIDGVRADGVCLVSFDGTSSYPFSRKNLRKLTKKVKQPQNAPTWTEGEEVFVIGRYVCPEGSGFHRIAISRIQIMFEEEHIRSVHAKK